MIWKSQMSKKDNQLTEKPSDTQVRGDLREPTLNKRIAREIASTGKSKRARRMMREEDESAGYFAEDLL